MRRFIGWAVLVGILWPLQAPLAERLGSNGAILASGVIGMITLPLVRKLMDLVLGEAAS